MSLRRMFFAGLMQQAATIITPAAPAAEAYRQRVLADGGVIFSQQAVVEAYAKAAEWGLPADRTHWSSPQFGYRTEAGGVNKRYCLFGFDAINSGAGLWQQLPAVAGKAAQMNTQKQAFEFMSWVWQDKTLFMHVVATPTAYTNSNASYGFFPLVEQGMKGHSTQFVLAFEQGSGFEAGVLLPALSVVTDNGYFPPLHQLQALLLRVDPLQATAPAQRRAWMSGRELTGQAAQGQLSAGAYPQSLIVLGQRFETAYSFVGNMNDVLITNALLPDAARTWLDAQINAY